MSKEMVEAFATLEKEKGIKQEIIVDAIKAALVAAYKKNYNQAQNVEVVFDEKISRLMQLRQLSMKFKIVVLK